MGARILVVDDSSTIRKVVCSILQRHDYAPIAADDGITALAVLEKEPVDLVLVDFVMPRMNGYQLCQALKGHPSLQDLPVVLMSAKGDKIRGKFLQQTGALDAITKPFDARGLIAVVESALGKVAEGRSRDQLSGDEIGSGPGSSPEAESVSQATSRASLAIAEVLAPRLEPELRALGLRFAEGDSFSQLLSRSLNDATLRLLKDAFDQEMPGEDEVLAGSLSAVSIAEILQLLELQRKSGALSVSHRRRQITFFFREGLLDFAAYSGLRQEFLLGRYLVEQGGLSRKLLHSAIEASRAEKKVLGDYLVDEGYLEAEVVKDALTRQSTELVYEVVRWRDGRFRFRENPENALASRTSLGIPTGGLVMEGYRRVDEWRLIEDTFNFSDTLYRDDQVIEQQADKNPLEELEKKVLSLVDGYKSVSDILDEMQGSSFEVGKVIYRLLKARFIKRSEA